MPLVRTSLARRGHPPVLRPRVRHRNKLSVAAALTLSPQRGQVTLHYQDLPGGFFDAELYAWFLRRLLGVVPGPLVLLHDGGPMHKGEPVSHVLSDFPRLHLYPLPPNAPVYNPVEPLWNFTKDKELANFVPDDVPQLTHAVRDCLERIRHDQHRLRSFFAATPLSWRGTTSSI